MLSRGHQIFFIGLMAGIETVVLPALWPHLPLRHRVGSLIAIGAPFMSLYLCRAAAGASVIIPTGRAYQGGKKKPGVCHARALRRYPYDRVLFHPCVRCRSCEGMFKPARSKHCRLCDVCVERLDHHCVWLAVCIGRRNYRYFLALLVSLIGLLGYGLWVVGLVIFSDGLHGGYPGVGDELMLAVDSGPRGRFDNSHLMLLRLAIDTALAGDSRLWPAMLLMGLVLPLPTALFVYHLYLIYAGTTTNETAKWSDWALDVRDGIAFIARASDVYHLRVDGDGDGSDSSHGGHDYSAAAVHINDPIVPDWPTPADQTLAFIRDGSPPRQGSRAHLGPAGFELVQPPEAADPEKEEYGLRLDHRWRRLESMQDIVNVYDLGFWRNLGEALFPKGNNE